MEIEFQPDDEEQEGDADARRVLGARAAVVGERWTGDAGGGFAATHVGAASAASVSLPTEVALLGPRPNPARGHALVPLELPTGTRVRVTVFDVLGRRVATLADGELDAGRHLLSFDGPALATGTYVVRADVGVGAGARVLTRRFTLVR